MSTKTVAVVGAGPGGLTAAMILARKGYEVTLFEKQGYVGGRNAAIELDGYTFDMGPTFLMMLWILEEAFQHAGRKAEDYLDIRRVDPYYRLVFADGREFYPTSDREKMREQIERLFPGDWAGYQRYLDYEEKKFERIAPCLQVPYSSLADYGRPRFLKALRYLDAHVSLHRHLGRYFEHEELKLAFTFQAKYLGMSPWKCPATFSIISYVEHTGGIHHPIGGLNQISQAMATVFQEEGGDLRLETPVEEVIVHGRRAVGVRLAGGEEFRADYVVVNADFGRAVERLFPRKKLRTWTPEKLEKKDLSCSGFMLYLGLNKKYEGAHHNILFAPDYRQNVREIAEDLTMAEDPSIYVQNAGVTDPTLAPEGKSALYVLAPVANNRSGIDWDAEKQRYRDTVLDIMERRGGYEGIRDAIEVEHITTPFDWEREKDVYRGAVFNLAHSIDQMLYFRPHNKFEEFDNCYLVGGGTHPGSGLPTIYESGIISAGLILKEDAWV